MRTSKKITIGILILLIIALLLYLFLGGARLTDPESGVDRPDPIFPFFGSDPDDDFFDEDRDDIDDDVSIRTRQPKLWQISDRPVAGSQWVESSDGEQVIWYVHQENGHLYEHDTEERESTRLTNTTIPQVKEAFIAADGAHIAYRYIDSDTRNVKTYLAQILPPESGSTNDFHEVDGSFLPDNLTAVSMSPSGSQLFGIQNTTDGSIGIVNNLQTNEARIIFRSPVKDWRSDWTNDGSITLFTRPSRLANGIVYSISVLTGNKTKVSDGSGVIVSRSPDNNFKLRGYFENNQYQTELSDMSERTTLMSVPTLTEKCSWAHNSNAYFCGVPTTDLTANPLTDWYQGKVSYTDNLSIFNPENRDQSNLFGEEEMSMGPFDIIDIKVDPDFNFLTFENKRSYILWGLEL